MEAGAAASSPGGLLAVGGGSVGEDLQEPPGSDPVATRQGGADLEADRWDSTDLAFAHFVAGWSPGPATLRPWISAWTSHHTAGLPGTSVSGVLTQLRAALLRGGKTLVQLDVASYFDAMTLPNLRRVTQLRHIP